MYITSPSSLSVRVRCKHCSGFPKYYSIAWDRWLLDNFYKDGRAQLKRNLGDLDNSYRSFRTKKYRQISAMSFRASHTQLASLYYKHTIDEDDEDFLIDLITCQCGKSAWKFKVSERNHIKKRRIRYDLPKRFPIR